jgi:acylphosphatase
MGESQQFSLHATVQGDVQGVGFRAFVLDNALRLGLTGWVRNRDNGDVEVWAEGDRADLDKLLDQLRKGPRASHVINVNFKWDSASGKYSRFNVAPTQY